MDFVGLVRDGPKAVSIPFALPDMAVQGDMSGHMAMMYSWMRGLTSSRSIQCS